MMQKFSKLIFTSLMLVLEGGLHATPILATEPIVTHHRVVGYKVQFDNFWIAPAHLQSSLKEAQWKRPSLDPNIDLIAQVSDGAAPEAMLSQIDDELSWSKPAEVFCDKIKDQRVILEPFLRAASVARTVVRDGKLVFSGAKPVECPEENYLCFNPPEKIQLEYCSGSPVFSIPANESEPQRFLGILTHTSATLSQTRVLKASRIRSILSTVNLKALSNVQIAEDGGPSDGSGTGGLNSKGVLVFEDKHEEYFSLPPTLQDIGFAPQEDQLFWKSATKLFNIGATQSPGPYQFSLGEHNSGQLEVFVKDVATKETLKISLRRYKNYLFKKGSSIKTTGSLWNNIDVSDEQNENPTSLIFYSRENEIISLGLIYEDYAPTIQIRVMRSAGEGTFSLIQSAKFIGETPVSQSVVVPRSGAVIFNGNTTGDTGELLRYLRNR